MGNFLLVLLALMMFTMDLSLTTADFARVLKVPTAAVLGALCQLVVLPACGWLIIGLFDLRAEMALGLMLICLCPGGVLSNYISFLARADVALSVSLTVISSFVTVFSMPILLNLVQSALGDSATEIQLPILDTMQFMASITVIPVALGMLSNHHFQAVSQRLAPKLSTACSVMLGVYILYVWSSNSDNIVEGFRQVGGAVSVLLLLTSAIVGAAAALARLGSQRIITLVIETGLQNSALAFTLAVVLLKNELLAVPNVFYSVAMFVPALIMVAVGRKLAAGKASKAAGAGPMNGAT